MSERMAWLRGVGQQALDVVFPRDCLECGEPVEISWPRYLCGKCAARLPLVSSPYCPTCGYPYDGEVEGERRCPSCGELEPVFTRGRTIGLLQGPLHTLVIDLKYHGGLYLLPDVERLALQAEDFTHYLRGGILVPVPLHRTRLRKRGYNQSERIACALGRAAGGLEVADILVRTRPTESQTRKTRKQRMANVKNAFALRQNHALVAGQRYILVDDVFTTGATLNACALALRKAGAGQVDVVTLAHG